MAGSTFGEQVTLGHDSAPIIVMVFSDFECPYCRRFVADSFPKFQAEFVDSSKAQFIFRHLPLDIHPAALLAAQSAECARRQMNRTGNFGGRVN